MKWIEALKVWNIMPGQNTNLWKVPKKNTPENTEVKELMGGKKAKEARAREEMEEEIRAVPLKKKKRAIKISDEPEVDLTKEFEEGILSKARSTAQKAKLKAFLSQVVAKKRANMSEAKAEKIDSYDEAVAYVRKLIKKYVSNPSKYVSPYWSKEHRNSSNPVSTNDKYEVYILNDPVLPKGQDYYTSSYSSDFSFRIYDTATRVQFTEISGNWKKDILESFQNQHGTGPDEEKQDRSAKLAAKHEALRKVIEERKAAEKAQYLKEKAEREDAALKEVIERKGTGTKEREVLATMSAHMKSAPVLAFREQVKENRKKAAEEGKEAVIEYTKTYVKEREYSKTTPKKRYTSAGFGGSEAEAVDMNRGDFLEAIEEATRTKDGYAELKLSDDRDTSKKKQIGVVDTLKFLTNFVMNTTNTTRIKAYYAINTLHIDVGKDVGFVIKESLLNN